MKTIIHPAITASVPALGATLETKPEIKIVRAPAPNSRDFHVLIDGEHRATFQSKQRFSGRGYEFKTAHGEPIRTRRYFGSTPITQADFQQVVADALTARKPTEMIPTRAEIERALLIAKAEREHQQWQDEIDRANAKLAREVYEVALARYIGDAPDAAHAATAEHLLEHGAWRRFGDV